MTVKERICLIKLEVQELSEAVEHYKPGWGCYGRKTHSKEAIKRDVKQVRAHLLELVDDLDVMEGN